MNKLSVIGAKVMAKDKNAPRKKGRKSYLNDFQPNLSGEYTYAGIHYRYAGGDTDYKGFRNRTHLLTLALAVGFLAPGFVRAGGMANCFYVLIPYIAEAISLFVSLFAVFKLSTGGARLREYIYEKSVRRLPASLFCCALFAALGLVCSAVFMLLNGVGGSAAELFVLIVGKLLAIAAAILFRKHILISSWEKEQ